MNKTAQESHSHIPIIDISALTSGRENRENVAASIGQACRDYGFFYVVGHGVDEHLQRRLEELSQKFFAQDLETKLEIAMARGGRAWRGYFPVDAELTSGKPDLKEGIYFGAELTDDHPLVKVGTPCTDRTCFPPICPSSEKQFWNICRQ
jgi:isopenicillin N synthase-like dioxygenase